MICLNQGTQPQVLVENVEAWTAEYVTWCENHPVGGGPRRYAHSDIRSGLELETSSKCAYCEGRISDVAYTNIEHKLPKRKYPQFVCNWENLTIACPKCNTNKGDYDDREYPLLDPYVDDVEEEVAFAGPLALPRGGIRAKMTITHLRLNRTGLLFARSETLDRLYFLLDLVERAVDEPDVLRSLWLEIDKAIADYGEFASACRQFIEIQMVQRGLTRY